MPWSVLSQGSGQLWGEQTAESEGGSRGTGQEETAVFQGREDTVLDPTIVMEAVESGRFWRPFLKTFKKNFFFFLSFWLYWVFTALSLLVMSRSYSPLQCEGFSLRWLLLLQSTSSRCEGFSCGSRTLEHRLSNWGAWA